MGKKIALLTIVGVIILIGLGVFMINNAPVKEIVVGKTQFSIPSEYQNQLVSENLVKISSGDKSYFINGNLDTNDIEDIVNRYVTHKNKTDNQSVEVSHLNSGGMDIYKSVVSDNSSIVHYWFLRQDKVYEIYTGTADSSSDSFVLDIINS